MIYTSDGVTQRQEYETTRAALMLERASFEGHWKELADWIIPRRLRLQVTDRNKGDRRNQKIIDSTATFAARTLRSGMHAGITSPARPWMRLTTPDPDLAEFAPVKEWLHTVTQRILTVFLRSNLYNVLPVVYGDMGVFGTAAMSVLEDERDVIRCYSYPVGSYALGMSGRQQVDTCIREYTMTVRQLVNEFGIDNVSLTVKNLYNRKEYNGNVEICWIVSPNPNSIPGYSPRSTSHSPRSGLKRAKNARTSICASLVLMSFPSSPPAGMWLARTSTARTVPA
jgi:hypothetical protein